MGPGENRGMGVRVQDGTWGARPPDGTETEKPAGTAGSNGMETAVAAVFRPVSLMLKAQP